MIELVVTTLKIGQGCQQTTHVWLISSIATVAKAPGAHRFDADRDVAGSFQRVITAQFYQRTGRNSLFSALFMATSAFVLTTRGAITGFGKLHWFAAQRRRSLEGFPA
jgi:hypothetical protein